MGRAGRRRSPSTTPAASSTTNGIDGRQRQDPGAQLRQRRHRSRSRSRTSPTRSAPQLQDGVRRGGRRRRRRGQRQRRSARTWGEEITEKAIRALVVFLVAVAVFISFRFEWRMALAAILAMVHDVVDQRRHLLGVRLRGHAGDGDRLPHHPRLLAVRHDRRVRPGPGERAPRSPAAGLTARRRDQRLDEPGADALAEHELVVGRCRCSRCCSSAPGSSAQVTLQRVRLALLVGMITGCLLVALHRLAAARRGCKARSPTFAGAAAPAATTSSATTCARSSSPARRRPARSPPARRRAAAGAGAPPTAERRRPTRRATRRPSADAGRPPARRTRRARARRSAADADR